MSCPGPGSSAKSNVDVQECDADVVRYARDTKITLMFTWGCYDVTAPIVY